MKYVYFDNKIKSMLSNDGIMRVLNGEKKKKKGHNVMLNLKKKTIQLKKEYTIN